MLLRKQPQKQCYGQRRYPKYRTKGRKKRTERPRQKLVYYFSSSHLLVFMELYAATPNDLSLSKLSPFPPPSAQRGIRRVPPSSAAAGGGTLCVRASAKPPTTALEHAGGKMVVELVGAFNELTERMRGVALSTSSSRILFKTLKLSIPMLQSLGVGTDGRPLLSKALSVAIILADLQVYPLLIP